MVTHHVDLVVDSCAWVVQLDDGVIAAQGSPETLRERGFLGDIKLAAHTSKTSAGITDMAKVNEPVAEARSDEAAQDKATRKLVEKEEKAELSPFNFPPGYVSSIKCPLLGVEWN